MGLTSGSEGELAVSSLLTTSYQQAQLLVSPDGTLNLRYTGDVLSKTKDIFSPIPGGIPIPLLDTLNLVTLPVVNNVIIKKAILTNGNFSYFYSHNRTEDINLQIWIPEMTSNKTTLFFLFYSLQRYHGKREYR